MTDYKEIFKTEENQNWAKCWVAVQVVTSALVAFCKHEIGKFFTTITTPLPLGKVCNTCQISEVLPYSNVNHRCKRPCKCPSKPCPVGVCDKLRAAIEQEHRFKEISWKNTNIQAWRTDVWEIAKCYFPPD